MSLLSLYNDNTTAHFKFKLCIIFHQYIINIKASARYASRVRATAPIFDCEQLLVIQSKSYEVEKMGFEPGLLHYMLSAPTVELRECDTSNSWFGILVWVIWILLFVKAKARNASHTRVTIPKFDCLGTMCDQAALSTGH